MFAVTMNSVKILHAVRSAITAIAELLVMSVGCVLLLCLINEHDDVIHPLLYFNNK